MTTIYVTSFNHASQAGVAEITSLLVDEFLRNGFKSILCEVIPQEIKAGDVLVVVDEFSEPLVIDALKNFRSARPKVTFVCVLTEFYLPRTSFRPPSVNCFKQPWQSLLFDNLLYVFCTYSGHLRLFTGLQISPPGPMHYAFGAIGALWLAAKKAFRPRTSIFAFSVFHERAYLWFRCLGLQNLGGLFDFYLVLHPAIRSDGLAAALRVTLGQIYTLLLPPPIINKQELINPRLKFGIDFSGSLTRYRKRALWKIIRLLRKLSPGQRFAMHTERGFDDSKMALLLSFNPPQSRTWKYSSPMRIIGAIKRGQIPLISEKFGDHPAEELALVVPTELTDAKVLATTLLFDTPSYIQSAWKKLENYRAIAEENNREIIRQLRKPGNRVLQ